VKHVKNVVSLQHCVVGYLHVLKRCKRKHPLFFYAMVANYGYVLKLYELNGKILMNILNYFEY
jgi:hypothetical protein